MRALLITIFAFLALPALAANERECRGKQAFDLGDGAYGCLIKIGVTSITTTRTRDDGASRRSSSEANVIIDTVLFGTFDRSRQVIKARTKAICRAFNEQAKKEMASVRGKKIVVQMKWPNEPPNRVVYSTTGGERFCKKVQGGFSNARCRGARVLRTS